MAVNVPCVNRQSLIGIGTALVPSGHWQEILSAQGRRLERVLLVDSRESQRT